MNVAPVESFELPAAPREGWTRWRWLGVIGLIFAAHIGFIIAFGEHKQIIPRLVTNVPALQIAGDTDELIALNDPTLFALPNPRDFAASVWMKMPPHEPPSFRWTEPPRWLQISTEALGATFSRFMQTNVFAGPPLDFKPWPKLSAPTLPIKPLLAQSSTMQIEGELAQRQLPVSMNLPDWPVADIIAPSRVQVLVDTAGNVVSAILLPADEGQYDPADQHALEIARAMRFKPASHLTVGRVIFHWHTVPPAATP
jgi:hypothetical protein